MKKVAIVIPYHRRDISPNEKISIRHLLKFLGNFDKFLALPSSIQDVYFKIPNAKIINFPNEYFTSVPKYCELLNTKIFYEKFLNYEYILIYQLDVLVFKNDLLYWCDYGYDFIGAPLFNSKIGLLTNPGRLPGCNGGFSLRRVDKFLKIIELLEKTSKRNSDNSNLRKLWFLQAILMGNSRKKWLSAPAKCYPFHEDGFWSFEAPKYNQSFRVAPFKDALRFGFERFPKKCFKINNNKLPFGCHAWEKSDKEFWAPYLLK